MNSNTPTQTIRDAHNAKAVESICAELVAVCDRAYAGLDFDAMRAAAVEGGMEEPYANAGLTVLRMSGPLERLYEYFQPRTDWTALGEILGRAKVPFTDHDHVSTDRYLDENTGLFTLTPDGQPHSGDFSFGTIGGTSIGTVTGELNNLARGTHPAQQIVEAARAFMNDRWAKQEADGVSGLVTAEEMPAGITGFTSRIVPAG